jgi:ATP-binding cassette subfamily F protein uup
VLYLGKREMNSRAYTGAFNFKGADQQQKLGNLSGGQRNRVHLAKMLTSGANVLLLDEPTNDLDIDTLNVIEDYLDRWPGTLVVVSHDRYFLERVTDTVYELPGDGSVQMLVGGVEAYRPRDLAARARADASAATPPVAQVTQNGSSLSGAEERAAQKELARIDRRLARLSEQSAAIEAEMAANATDISKLSVLQEQLSGIVEEKDTLEASWLEIADVLG